MAGASAASIAQWEALKKSGVSWGEVAKKNAADLAAYRDQLIKKNPKYLIKNTGPNKVELSTGFGGSVIPDTYDSPALSKLLEKFKQTQPHQAPGKFQALASSIAKKVIPAAAIGGVVAGVGTQLATALSSSGQAGGMISKVTGGFGTPAAGVNAASVISEGSGSGLSDTLDDIFGGLSKAGQYAKGAGEALQNFRSAFGGGDDDGGGGGPAYAAAPPAAAPAAPAGGMPKWAWWAIGGGVVLVLILVFVSMRKR